MTPEEIIAAEKQRQAGAGRTPEDILSDVQADMEGSGAGSLNITRDMVPDEAANVVDLADRAGMDFGMAWRNRDALKSEADRQSTRTALMTSTRLAEHMADPRRAAVARDSIDQLLEIERRLNPPPEPLTFGRVARTGLRGASLIGQGMVAGGKGLQALPDAAITASAEDLVARADEQAAKPEAPERRFTLELGGTELDLTFLLNRPSPQVASPLERTLNAIAVSDPQMRDLMQAVADESGDSARETLAEADALMPEAEGTIEAGLASGGRSLAQMLPAVLAGLVTRNANVAAAGMGGTVFGPEYLRARDEGLGIREAQAFAGGQAAIEIGTERLPMGFLIGDIGSKTPILKRLFRYQAAEQVTEQLATLGQDFLDWQVLNPEKTAEQFLAERPEAAAQTAIATLVAAGAMQAGTMAAEAAFMRGQSAEETEAAVERMSRVREAVEAAPVFARRREDVEAFIANASEGETVLLDDEGVTELYQSDPAKFTQLMTFLDVPEDQIQAAFDGQDVEVDAARLLTLPERADYDALVEVARTSPGALTLREARAQADDAAGSVDMQALEAALSDEAQAFEGFERVQRSVQQQLIDAGRSPEEAEAAGAIWGSVFRVFAEDGVDEATVFEKLGLRIEGEGGRSRVPDESEVLTQEEIDVLGAEAQRQGALTAAAVQVDGRTFTGQNHGEAAHKAEEALGRRLRDINGGDGIAGFMDTQGRFLRRDDPEAILAALANDQIEDPRARRLYERAMAGAGRMRGLTSDVVTLAQAQSEGFEGTDTGEAEEWLEASRKGLDMSTEARMARAREQGFDTETVLYHGTDADVDAFRPSEGGSMGSGVYLSSDAEAASSYSMLRAIEAEGEGAKVIPAYIRGRVAPQGSWSSAGDARDSGFAGVQMLDQTLIFDPSNIRSVHAAFDPDRTESANLLAQSDFGATPAVDLTTEQGRRDFLDHEVLREPIEGGGPNAMRYGFQAGTHRYLVEFTDWPEGNRGLAVRVGRVLDQGFTEPVRAEDLGEPDIEDLVSKLYVIVGENARKTLRFEGIDDGGETFFRELLSEGYPDAQFDRDDTGFTARLFSGVGQNLDGAISDTRPVIDPNAEFAFLQSLRDFDGPANRLRVVAARAAEDEGRGQAPGTQQLLDLEAGIRDLLTELEIDRAGPFGGLVRHYERVAIDAIDSGEADVAATLDAMRARLSEHMGRDGGQTLFQAMPPLFQTGDFRRAGDKARGTVAIPGALDDLPGAQILSDRDVIVRLTKAADKTTFLHESAHIFLELYAALESESPQIAERMAAIRKLLKLKPGEKLTRDQHEQFAELFETYLMEGKAPNAELKSVFRRFRAWFTSVYRYLRGQLPALNDEAREIFDRMLATDEEIQIASAQYTARLTDAMSGIMTPEQVTRHEDFARKAGDVARDKLFRKHVEQIRRRERKQYREDEKRIGEEVRTELEDSGVYRALAEHSDDGRTLKEGIDYDMIAPDYGFVTGEELRAAADLAPPIETAIEAETRRRMVDLYGDLLTDETTELEAIEAVFNEPSVKMLEAERDALALKASAQPIPLNAIKEHARRTIEQSRISDVITPGRYAIKARTLHRRSLEAAAKGNWDAALRYTHQAMLQHEMARLAYKAREEIGRIRNALKPYEPFRFPKKDTHKKMAPEFVEALVDLMSLPGSDNQFAKLLSLRSFAATQAENDIAIQLPSLVEADQPLPDRRNMTLEQLREFRDSVRNIARQGRANSVEEKARFSRYVESLGDKIRASYTGKAKRETRNPKLLEQLTSKAREVEALILRYPFLVEALQGGKEGAVVDALEQGLRRQLTLRNARRHGMHKQLVAILDKHQITQAELNERISAPAIEAGPVKFEQVFALALNMGTESNRERIAGDPSLGDLAAIDALLDQRLDKRHWDAAQEIWDLIGSMWPEAVEVEKRVSGITPKKVEARTFANRHGTYSGGYYPIAYDRGFLSNRDLQDADMKDLWSQAVNGMATHASTKKGFLKERQENVQRPLSLRLDNIIRHVDDVTNDIYMREETIAISRILRHPAFRAALAETHGQEYGKTLETVLKRSVHGTERSDHSVEQLFRTLRINASVAILGLNVRTALLAPISYFQTVIPRYGVNTIMDGVASFYGNAMQLKGAQSFITTKSEFMRERVDTLSREAHERLRNAKRQSTWHKAQGAGYWLMSFVEIWSVSGPTWMGVYRNALAEGKSEADAITDADRAVATTQGSGLEIDQSILQGGSEFSRSLTFMWGYVSGYYGVVRNDIARAKGYAKAWPVVKHLIILNIMASMAEGLLRAASGEGEDEDPYLVAVKDMFWRNIIGMLPGVSQMANRYGSESPAVAAGSGLFDSFRAWERAAEELGETGEIEGETVYQATRSTLKSVGIAAGFPGTLQIDKSVNTLVVDDDPTLRELVLTGADDDN